MDIYTKSSSRYEVVNDLIGMLLTSLGLDMTSHIGGSIQFFVYDVLKITYLLCLLIFIISYIQSYFPPERQLY